MPHQHVVHRGIKDALRAVAASEAAAARFLHERCWKDGALFCPRCSADKIYTLGSGRYRCSACRYTFRDFTGRWINNGGLSCQNWLRLLDLFVEETTAHQMSIDLNLSYNAIYKALTATRFAIMAQALDFRQLLGAETGLGDYLKGKKLTGQRSRKTRRIIPVFGIIEKAGWVFIDLVPDILAETVLHFNANFQLRVIRTGNILYTDRYKTYDALILCCDASLPLQYIRNYERDAYVDSVGQAFWTFARSRLKRYKGVSAYRFPLYLKELEFRYNHRKQDLFPLLAEHLCSLVPDNNQVARHLS
ncbi:MAG: IS1595 family transposase [Desulfovibrionaceae bacterium]|nr:IS1595 family transposase [Desulfovibrionaceae bacterium]